MQQIFEVRYIFYYFKHAKQTTPQAILVQLEKKKKGKLV